MEAGSKVWARGGPTLWQEGVVKSKTDKSLTVILSSGGSKDYDIVSSKDGDECDDIKLRNVPGQASEFEGPNIADLTKLTYLSEPTILYSLHSRYQNDTIYTYTGPILLAVNPFKKVDLYSDATLLKYKVDGERRCYDPTHVDNLPPHVYAISDRAYRNMTTPTTELALICQSILVSGESGAGKTETCKIIMKYLAILGNAGGEGKALGQIENQVLESNPILEAFGNARTVRNDNSSRFGKYIQIYFGSTSGKLQGAAISTFLLEKIRVVKQVALERNFHIFYVLLAAATPEQRQSWGLKSAKEYSYTNKSGCYDRRDGVTDTELHAELMHAFVTMGITTDEWTDCFSTVAAVLALGNLVFEKIPGAKDDERQTTVTEASKPFLKTAAELLGCDDGDVASCLTSRQVTAGFNTQVTIYLTSEQANHARDAMAKAIYAAMFTWMVKRINSCISKGGAAGVAGAMATQTGDKRFIGLLDIFGFEIFKENYFEQFLINFANEVLQQQFNDFVFKQEQEEYRVESIEWTFIKFPDNKDTIAMIEAKPNGIIPTLDEQCLIGQATDERYARELYKKCESHASFEVSNKMRANHQFQIQHYAGKVCYETTGIIEKNRDTLAQEGLDVLLNSINDFVVELGEIERHQGEVAGSGTAASRRPPITSSGPTGNRRLSAEGTNPSKAPGGLVRQGSKRGTQLVMVGGAGKAGGKRSTIGAKSLASQFKQSLAQLIELINRTHPHFVRCVKPNDALKPGTFDHERIAEQLRNAGVLEVVRVARAGFPVRLGIAEFIERYGLLALETLSNAYRQAAKEGDIGQEAYVCKALVKAMLELTNGGPLEGDFATVCREQGLQVGLTKVFFQQVAFSKMERLRTAKLAGAALTIQTVWRMAHARRAYLVRKGAIAAIDDTRRLKGLMACRLQQCFRNFLRRRRLNRALTSARAAREAVFQQQIAAIRSEYDEKVAALEAELKALQAALEVSKSETEVARKEVATLKAKPSKFMVFAAPVGDGCVDSKSVMEAVQKALQDGGVDGSQTLIFGE